MSRRNEAIASKELKASPVAATASTTASAALTSAATTTAVEPTTNLIAPATRSAALRPAAVRNVYANALITPTIALTKAMMTSLP